MCGAEVKSPEKGLFAQPQLVCILWPLEPPEFQDNVLMSEPELWGYLDNFSEQIFWNFLMLLLFVLSQLIVWKEAGQLWKRFSSTSIRFLLHLPAAAVRN